MYNFTDVIANEVSGSSVLPSEALSLNGEYIENLIPGYRTLQVEGREALSPELETFETGSSDGATLKYKRYPARVITVTYQLIAESNEAFREAYNKLASILDVEEAELIFNDETDKFFKGTPSAIGEVPPGRNAVVGEFELFCADPFKYSVIEYEAEPLLDDGSFLIDYNGTYKAYPTLEAEFFNEDEAEAELTGSGDCGYVAFFNEDEKIIQLGDPDETDTETYPKSQTLVNQKFQAETAWGTIAQTNWVTNNGKIPYSDNVQSGNVAMAVAHYSVTEAPSTSGTLLTKASKEAKPYIDYKVTAKTTSRAADRVNVEVTITASLSAKTNSGATSISSGAAVALKNTKVYYSSTSASASFTRTGTYYLWDSSIKSGRIRITNAKSRVGKSGEVTGWVNVSDIGAAATSGSSALGKAYGLKASICFLNGEWKSATLKKVGVAWSGNNSYSTKLTVTVKDIEDDTTVLEDIKFMVERTDEEESKVGILEETACKDLEISAYTAPVPGSWYLKPETFGTSSNWHGPSITRTIPADAAGDVGAANFTFSYKQKMSIGTSSSATQELGAFMALIISGSGNDRKILAGVNIVKTANGKKANLRFFVNGKQIDSVNIDLSFNNKYFGNSSAARGINTVKTSTITKTGGVIVFNIGGIKRIYADTKIRNTKATEITFYTPKYSTKPSLSYNGLYWAKFVKNNSDTWEDIPNKFSANDVVTADCKSGNVYLNDTLTPSLGALGNDWENFYLTPGLNQIGFSYSSWVKDDYAPKFKIRYREVFL